MSENPDDWRSAVDASSGRTYWYHRKTRVSTWIRPDFAEPTTTAELQQHNRDSQKDTAKTNHDTESIHCSNSTVVPQNSPFTSTFKRILLKMAQNPQQSVVAEHTSLLETVDKHNFLEADAGEIISQLVHVSILSQDGYGARHAALRCLLYLSETQEHEFAARFIHTNQAWTSLAAYAPTWKWKVLSSSVAGDSINDPESILLVSALMCNLFIGPTYYSISEESKDCLVELLDSTFIQNTDSIVDFDVLLRNRASGGGDALQLQSTAVLSDRTVQTYTLLAEKGHSLPAVWLLAIFTQSFRAEKLFVQMVQLGFLQALKAMCISSKLATELKATARECLLSAMASSGYVRDRVLDSLLELSADLAAVPVAMGPEPILYSSGAPASCGEEEEQEEQEEQEEEEQHQDEGQDSSEGAGEAEVPVMMSRAQAKYKRMSSAGFCDVPVGGVRSSSADGLQQDEEDVWNNFNRDVEWIPKSGTPWRLSSSILWARCPALRELISGFWDEGGGGLELSIDACDEVLASLCRYMHTGLLVLPVRLHRQLELLRVSSELGMNSLYLSACEALLQKLTMDCVPAVISFCADHQFSDLERSCRTFLTSGGRRAPVIRYQPAGDQNPQNAYLRDAIFASLQDVNAVLNQHPHSQAKLRVAAPSGQQSALTAVPIQTAPSVRSLHPHSPAAELSAQSSTQRDGQQNSYYSNEVDDSFGLNSASLLDLAAGRGAGLSMSREDFSHGDNNVNAFQTDYLEELAQAGGSAFSHAVEYTASSSFSTANNNPPRAGPRTDKPRAGSGGIYGLLLQGATGSAAAVAVPTKAANVPGKVVATEKRPGSAGTNPKSKLALAVNKEKAAAAARAGTAPAAASGRPGSARTNDPPTIATAAADATPRTQRASSLLASARPRHSAYLDGEDSSSHSNAYNQLSGDDFDGRDYYGGGSVIPIGEEADWRGDASFVDSQDGAFGPQEFSTRMSLAPQRDKTPNEKRIERLTRPTKVLGAKDKLAKKATNAQEDGEEEDEEGKHDQAAVDVGDSRMSAPAPATSPVPIGAAAKTQKIAITPSSSSTSSVSAGKPEGLARLKAGAATSGKPPQRPPTDSTGLVALKRSVSPATSHSSSKEGHLLSIGSVFHDDAADSNSSGGMYSPPPRSASSDINVRGSLTLLKTKAASSRRRRSVADIEGAQTRDAGGATAATGGGTDGEDTGAPNYSSRLNRNNYSASVAGDEPQAAFYNRNPAHVSLDLTNYAISDGDNAGEDTTEKAGEEEPTFEQTDEFDGGGGVASRPTMECPTCSRMFNPLPFEKHVKVCAKVFVGKRKTFDSAKMRIEGNPDLKSFVEEESKSSGGRGGGAGKKGKPTLERKTSSGKEMSGAAATPTSTTAGANSKWKEQSDAFRAAMKSARDVSIAIATGAPLPPPTVSAPDSSLVQCPHCQRRFNASAAERHIPVCQNIRAKPASLKRGGGGNASNGSTTGVSSAVKGRNWQ